MSKRVITAPLSERAAVVIESKLRDDVEGRGGRFMRAEDGSLHVVLGDRRIPLKYDRENLELAALMLESCNVTTLSTGAQAAIQRFQVYARQKAGKVQLRNFSALSQSGERLYIPLAEGRLVRVTAEDITVVANGESVDTPWVEHPCADALRYAQGDVRADGLAAFERLLVNTQACRVPEKRWLVAMHEGFFPYVRDICRARMLLVHVGGTQQGKTSGAQRFSLLHGLGEVKGDYSVAALANMGDIGLLVMDNKEQANFSQALIDFCLFLSTGAERGRSSVDGVVRASNKSRAAGVITTIEGAWKPELQARCVEVHYEVLGKKAEREPIEDEILRRRHEIRSSMVPVFQRWLNLRNEGRTWPTPTPDFARHFSALCGLLCAYGEVAAKPEGWAESIIGVWCDTLRGREADEDELEQPLRRVFDERMADAAVFQEHIVFNDRHGTLYYAECGTLLACLQKLNLRDRTLPKNETGLGRRLRSAKFKTFTFLDTDTPDVPQLKRTAKKRPIGFFFEE